MLDAEVKMGQLTAAIPKAQGKRTDLEHMDTVVPKSEQLEEIGITEKQKQRFEALAKHPEVVKQVKQKEG